MSLRSPRQRDPCRNLNVPWKLILLVKITQIWCIVRPFAPVCLKTEPRQGEGPGAVHVGYILFQPVQTQNVLRPLWLIAQGQKRPNRRNDQRFPRDAVYQGIAAIPSAARTHPIVEHQFCELPASRRRGWQ